MNKTSPNFMRKMKRKLLQHKVKIIKISKINCSQWSDLGYDSEELCDYFANKKPEEVISECEDFSKEGYDDYQSCSYYFKEKIKKQGYLTYSDFKAGMKGGFTDGATYSAAKAAGFADARKYAEAQAKGAATAADLKASKLGFANAEEYREAKEGGFSDRKKFLAARQAGFEMAANYEEGLKRGFSSGDSYRAAKAGGFDDAKTYAAAVKKGFKTAADYAAGLKGGFANAMSYVIAKKAGFVDAKTYAIARKKGFDTASDYQSALNSGFSDSKSYKAAKLAKTEKVKESAYRATTSKPQVRPGTVGCLGFKFAYHVHSGMTVLQVAPGSPADVGSIRLRPGVLIKRINGNSIINISSFDLRIMLLRGNEGEPIEFEYLWKPVRPGSRLLDYREVETAIFYRGVGKGADCKPINPIH
jgi:hypothetical protein